MTNSTVSLIADDILSSSDAPTSIKAGPVSHRWGMMGFVMGRQVQMDRRYLYQSYIRVHMPTMA